MDSFDLNTDANIKMINEHRKRLNDSINTEKFEKLKKNSVGKKEIVYGKKKKKKKKNVNNALTIFALSASLALGATVGAITTNIVVNSKNAVTAISTEDRQDVKEKINYYAGIMGTHSDKKDWQVEEKVGWNHVLNEPYVDYHPTTLAKNIVVASQISEEDVRCVVYAAYSIANKGGYKEKILMQAFNNIERVYTDKYGEIPKELQGLLCNGLEGYLDALGYEDIKDYQRNEKNSIIDERAINSRKH